MRKYYNLEFELIHVMEVKWVEFSELEKRVLRSRLRLRCEKRGTERAESENEKDKGERKP